MADVTRLGGGRYLISEGGGQRTAYAAGPPDARWVFLEGQTWLIDTRDPHGAPRARHVDEQTALSAPMPATVLAIAVEPGQRVAGGEVLIMLEAMKMEVPIRSPREGVVSSIACRPGELVSPGVPLVALE